MRPAQTAAAIAAFERRGAGTDSERRAGRWLGEQLEVSGHTTVTEPFWCRPNWALAHVWHVALALAGSLLSVGSPRIGGALILAALISLIVDERLGISPGRLLTRERASQNVIATRDRRGHANAQESLVRLIITANYDAGRAGLVYRNRVRAAFTRLGALTGHRGPGWLGWLVIACAWLLITSILRLEGARGTVIGLVQLPPTIALVIALALLLELATADFSPAAGDNGSGAAVALALTQALAAAPPANLDVELVLQGAGDGFPIGLRKYLRQRRRAIRPANVVVLGIAHCANGHPRWWLSDGQLVPLRYLARLRALCADVADRAPHLKATTHRGRGATPALPARSRRLPAIAIGCLDGGGRAPRSHQRSDTAESLDPAALDEALEFGLTLIDAVDAFLRTRPSDRRHRIALRWPLAVLAGRQREPSDQLRA
jgi:Peptidase family M28